MKIKVNKTDDLKPVAVYLHKDGYDRLYTEFRGTVYQMTNDPAGYAVTQWKDLAEIKRNFYSAIMIYEGDSITITF